MKPLTRMIGTLIFLLVLACPRFANQGLVTETNKAYYNLQNYGVKSIAFKVEVEEDALMLDFLRDIAPEENVSSIPECLAYYVTLAADGTIHIQLMTATQTNIPKLSHALALRAEGAKEILDSFLATWHGFMFESVLSDLASELDEPYAIEFLNGGRVFRYSADGTHIEVIFTKDHKCSSLKAARDNTSTIFKPNFLDTEKGYLLQSYSLRIDDHYISENTIAYVRIRDCFLPKRFQSNALINGESQQITFLFSEHTIQKERGSHSE